MEPILRVEKLVKRYVRKNSLGSNEELLALDGVSFAVTQGTTFALVGESGSGKSSLGFCISCLESPTTGSIWFEGRDITVLTENERRHIRPQLQLIFQDPSNSLNPRWRVEEILLALLAPVGLSSDILQRSPAQLSGGQRQRLAIARALALEPKLLILDEALSALDCSIQAQIANLLMELQRNLGMTYLFITHDLAMAAHLADEIAVMYRGRIMEQGPTQKVLRSPAQEITKNLLAAMPSLDRAPRLPLDS